jgi:hypothetical protein
MRIIIIASFALLLTASQCTMGVNRIMKYEPEKQQTISIPKIELERESIVKLREDAYTTIGKISSVALNGKANTIAIINEKELLFYDNSTGLLIKKIEAKFDMTDLVANSQRQPYIDSNIYFRRAKVPYVPIKDYKTKKIDKDIAQKAISNSFLSVRCINDEFYACASIMCYFVAKNYDQVLDNVPVLFRFDENLNSDSYKVIEMNKNSHTVAFDFWINNHMYVTSSGQYKLPAFGGEFESYPTAAKFDLEGNYIETMAHMSQNYLLKGKYNLFWVVPKFVEINQQILMLYPDELTVFGEHKKLFDLQNLPFKNDTGFVFYENYARYCRSIDSRPEMSVLSRLFPIKIIDAFENDNKLYPIMIVWDKNYPMGFYFLIQEYTHDGKLLREISLFDEPENQIRQFAFNKHDKQLVIFKKSFHTWTAEKWSMR